VEGRVLAETDDGDDGVEEVLVGREAVDADCEGKDELSQNISKGSR